MGSFMINYPSYKNSSIYSPLIEMLNKDFWSLSDPPSIERADPFAIRDTSCTKDGVFELKVIAPGRSRDDFSVTVQGRTVSVKTNDKEGAEFNEVYKWSYDLYPHQDADAISVSMENGVLTLQIPHATPQEPEMRQLKIS
jgi:HSP20 family molecular chaperone IbpA